MSSFLFYCTFLSCPRFSAEFDFRTYDNEGVILYAESPDYTAWILLALRDGKIEIQFKNEVVTKVTTGGKAINDGSWHIVSLFFSARNMK